MTSDKLTKMILDIVILEVRTWKNDVQRVRV